MKEHLSPAPGYTLIGVLGVGALLCAWLVAAPLPAVEAGLGVSTQELIGQPAGRPLSGAELDRATEELASQMRCPVCQGLSVADSPTDSALAMKAEVREFLAAGYTPDQTLAYFEGSYGEFIRLSPKGKGFNLTVWLAPLVALLLGGGVIAARVRGRKVSVDGAAESAPDEAELADYLARVRREVEE